jgi:hypothetical protein
VTSAALTHFSAPVLGSAIENLLVERGFRSGPRRLTLSA